MQQCDSPYVVKYYGSYFKNTDLWIVMEYCEGTELAAFAGAPLGSAGQSAPARWSISNM